jgi:hypothetical protein
MLVQPVPTICILLKDYYDIEAVENIKALVAKMPHFRFFISPQYRKEPRYDIYVVSDKPAIMMHNITSNKLIMQYIDMISVNEV